eukprot:6490498-Pyramimonas_sp.AAC.1
MSRVLRLLSLAFGLGSPVSGLGSRVQPVSDLWLSVCGRQSQASGLGSSRSPVSGLWSPVSAIQVYPSQVPAAAVGVRRLSLKSERVSCSVSGSA